MTEDFDDNILPLAYLITFRCYGTWFHGNAHGSVDRRNFNTYGKPRITPNVNLEKIEQQQLAANCFILNKKQREVVESSIREVCKFRSYQLHAVNAQINHVYCVVSADSYPEKIMNGFKSYATRSFEKS